MSGASTSKEADVIKTAYEERVRALFIGLATNLGDGSTEQQSVDRFKRGLDTARRARELAMNVVGIPPMA